MFHEFPANCVEKIRASKQNSNFWRFSLCLNWKMEFSLCDDMMASVNGWPKNGVWTEMIKNWLKLTWFSWFSGEIFFPQTKAQVVFFLTAIFQLDFPIGFSSGLCSRISVFFFLKWGLFSKSWCFFGMLNRRNVVETVRHRRFLVQKSWITGVF